MVASSTYVGRFTSGVLDTVVQPNIKHRRRPVLYFHGRGGNAYQASGASFLLPSVEKLASRLASEHFTVVAPTNAANDGSGFLFDSDTAMARGDDAVDYALTSLDQMNLPPIVIGSSGGSLAALRWASLNPVSCLVGMLSLVDFSYIYDNDVLGTQTEIEAVFGIAHPTALPLGTDPIRDLTDELSSVSMQLWYANDDEVSTNIVDFSNQTGAEIHDVGALGHTNEAIEAVDFDEVMSFIRTSISA